MGTLSPNTPYIGKTGGAHRDYYFSSYDTNYWNQAGFFCWNGVHCTGKFSATIFGDLNQPYGNSNAGYVEIFVR